MGAYKLIFGETDTLRLLEYFDGKYTDMVAQTLPFFYDVIEPAVQRSVEEKRRIVASNMRLSRAQRRRLGL